MPNIQSVSYTFVSDGLPDEIFEVVNFSGTEAISKPYEYLITLSSENPDIDLAQPCSQSATLTITRGGEITKVHGILSAFDLLHQANYRIFYRAVLVPNLWKLGMNRESRVYLDSTVPEIIEDVLGSRLTYDIPDWSASTNYVKREYVCQYQESDLDFISRWMEREGIYYFFDQTGQSEKLIIRDDKATLQDIPGGSELSYSPDSGLIPAVEDVVNTFTCRQQVLPKSVVLRDYDYLHPDVKVESDSQPIVGGGQGEVYIYGEDFNDKDHGNALAKIRAAERSCRETVYYGKASAPALAPGYFFTLSGHFRSGYNRKYLITEVRHNGSQTGMLLTGTEETSAASDAEPGYSNHFTCIPDDAQFRPERKTPWPVVRGSQTAVVVGPSGQDVSFDEFGRVKVQFHWDREGKKDEKSSFWIRVSQLWAGKQWGGLHIPHVGQEVIVGFIEGDPDRPIIIGRVYNQALMPPLSPPEDNLKSIIRDRIGNEIIFDATEGDSRISLYSPEGHSLITAGKDNTWWMGGTDAGELFLGSKVAITGLWKSETFVGSSSSIMAGVGAEYKLGAFMEAVAGVSTKLRLGPEYQIAVRDKVSVSEKDWMQVADGDAIIDSHGAKDTPAGDTGKVMLIAGDKHQSLLVMGNEGFTLSVGEMARAADDKSRERSELAMAILVLAAGGAHLLNSVGMLGDYIAAKYDKPWEETGADLTNVIGSSIAHVVSIAAAIASSVLAVRLYHAQMKPDKVKGKVIGQGRKINTKIEITQLGEIRIDTSASNQNITVNSGSAIIKLTTTNKIELDAPEVTVKNKLTGQNIIDLAKPAPPPVQGAPVQVPAPPVQVPAPPSPQPSQPKSPNP